MSVRIPGFALLFVIPVFAATSEPLIHSVEVPGTALAVKLGTQVGQPYDRAVVEKDVKYLWSLGRFDDIRVEATDTSEGTDVVFHVTRSPVRKLHDIRIEPTSFGVETKLPEGTVLDGPRVQQIVTQVTNDLKQRGYVQAHVEPQLAPYGNEYDLKLKVSTGDAVRVKYVNFAGDTGLAESELRGALKSLRPKRLLPGIPGVWNGWRLLPSYSQEAVDSDASRLLSFYLSKGYFDATVQPRTADIQGKEASVTYDVRAGMRFRAPETAPKAAGWDSASVCRYFNREERDAQRHGVLDFTARLKIDDLGDGVAKVTPSVERGREFHVRRIEFFGNHSYTDSAVRRNFVLDEGVPLDDLLLRKSLARLNRTGWFEDLGDKSVIIMRNEASGLADIRVGLKQRKVGRWSISGPVGPASLAGPLEASIRSRLPGWGRGIFELSTYTASVGMFAFQQAIIPGMSVGTHWPVLMLARPFTPSGGFLSGFTIAPQIGWQSSAISYGVTQLTQRLLPVLTGDRGLVPDLPVTVSRPEGDAIMMCPAPQPTLKAVRMGAAVALQFLGAVTTF